MDYVRFTADRTTVEADPQVFLKGRVYKLSPASCERWKRRNVAVDATEAEFAAQAKADHKAKAEKAGKKDTKTAVQASGQLATNTTREEAEAGTAAGSAGDTTSSAGDSEEVRIDASTLQSTEPETVVATVVKYD